VHFKDLDAQHRFIELGEGTIVFPPIGKIFQKSAIKAGLSSIRIRQACFQFLGISGKKYFLRPFLISAYF